MTKIITIQLFVDENTERDHRIFKDGSTIEQYIENAITSTLEDDMIAVSSIVTEDEGIELRGGAPSRLEEEIEGRRVGVGVPLLVESSPGSSAVLKEIVRSTDVLTELVLVLGLNSNLEG